MNIMEGVIFCIVRGVVLILIAHYDFTHILVIPRYIPPYISLFIAIWVPTSFS